MRVRAVLLLSLLAGAVLGYAGAGTVERDGATPVVLITIESLRADHVGPCYGYDRETAPAICEIARDGVLFEQAYSQGSETPMSIPVLLSGRSPRTVGLESWEHTPGEELVTIAETLDAAGYETDAAIIPESWRTGTFTGDFEETLAHPNDIRFDRDRFLWYFIRAQVHEPYTPPAEFRRWDTLDIPTDDIGPWFERQVRKDAGEVPVEDIVALYDGEVREASEDEGHGVRYIIERLKDAGRYDDALIIVTADHGERLRAEEIADHGGTPAPEVTHVPLIIKFPHSEHARRRVTTPVRHMDVVPTIHDVLNITGAPPVDGTSLLPVIRREETAIGPIIAAGRPRTGWGIIEHPYELVVDNMTVDCDAGRSVLHRIRQDGSLTPIPDPDGTRHARLESELCAFYRGSDPPIQEKRDLSAALKERLREMGYLEER